VNTAVRTVPGATIVDVFGHVDLGSSPSLRKTLLDSLEAAAQLAVNLTAVRYIDSSGIASLLEVLQSARSCNKRFVLFGAPAAVNEALLLTRLSGVFEMYATEDEAVGAAGRSGSVYKRDAHE
jgi:anti-sigma B factor antagonist